MRKIYILIIAIFIGSFANAQNYLINFTGSGAANTVDSVKVQNLTQNTTLSLSGSDILELIVSVGIKQINSTDDNLKIYPNPMQGQAELSFYAKQAGNTQVLISDITGKEVVQISRNLAKGKNKYKITDLKQGIYYINIIGENYLYTAKLISINKNQNETKLGYQGNETPEMSVNELKSTNSTVSMAYTTGDRLLFKGTSGNYSNIITDIPVTSKTITFNFVPCTDFDNNNYSTVKIGNQIWMAENLKTTHYKNGTVIPNVTNDTTWAGLTTGAYCDYNNTPSNSEIYGRLYNWYAVNTGNLCPAGWHVPSDAEWTTLTTYLGGNSIAGGKLKETGLAHWLSPNTAATNESGFTALPGGSGGSYGGIGSHGYWWSSTEDNTTYAWYWHINYGYGSVARSSYFKHCGISVRCLKD